MKSYIVYIFILISLSQNLLAIGVSAGTKINNVAYLNYKIGSAEFKSTSNELVDIVDQKIDMKIVCQESDMVTVAAGEERRAMGFMLKNRGNGEDSYLFSAVEGEILDFKVNNAEVYLDNGDGVFSILEDRLADEIKVPADKNISLFLVSDIPSDATKLSSNGIKASSTIQGNLLYGEFKKLDDFYAVIAAKEDAKLAFCTYEVSPLAIVLEKSATLSSDKVYRGSTIHYKIAVKAIGEGNIENIVVTDTIPNGTVYVEDSLMLDDTAMGDFNGSSISVVLSSITQTKQSSESLHHITFDVRVQ